LFRQIYIFLNTNQFFQKTQKAKKQTLGNKKQKISKPSGPAKQGLFLPVAFAACIGLWI
jgi:hypothetical protein